MGFPSQIRCGRRSSIVAAIDMLAAALLLATFPSALFAQAAEPVAPSPSPSAQNAQPAASTDTGQTQPREKDRRRAARLFLAASKLFMDEHFEDALAAYEQASKLDPAMRITGWRPRLRAVTR